MRVDQDKEKKGKKERENTKKENRKNNNRLDQMESGKVNFYLEKTKTLVGNFD